MTDTFKSIFRTLSGHEPLSWQSRLYELFKAGAPTDLPSVIDLPTGIGKTMVMAIWLIARTENPCLGRRLIYVVDRRTVVDQATDLALSFQEKLGKGKLAISTLRGQYADNRDWTRDPSKPAIIIGTVDMIGSRLLFSGYRSSYKLRPLDAGMLGQDSLLVLDEAHLSEPFAKLTRSVKELNQKSPLPFKVMHMSATSSSGDGERFTLEPADLVGNRDENLIVRRFEAEKRLVLHDGITDSNSAIVGKTVELVQGNSRVVVFVRSPDTVTKLADAIRNHVENKQKPFANDVAVLTGTMRGLERDELLKKPENADHHERRTMQRFLDPDNRPDEGPAILISTSAGEVGFDLNADHLVCDSASLDSIIQRFGRVNRRGDGHGDSAAQVHLFAEKPKEPKKGKKEPKKDDKGDSAKHTIESASAAAMEVLRKLPQLQNGPTETVYDASPKAFASLTKPDNALSPKPATLELTDILLDAWSMTTIAEPMPGRPPVAPWLRGITEEGPQTTIAWRAELDLDGFDGLDIDDIEEWLDVHRIMPHETLAVPIASASTWLIERWNILDEKTHETVGNRSCIIDRGGLRLVKVKDLIVELEQKRTDSIRDADIILPASFGGIERHKGLLDKDTPKPVDPKADSSAPDPRKASDVADERERYRQLRVFGEDTDETKPLVGQITQSLNDFSRFTLDLPANGDTRQQLISFVPKLERLEAGMTEQLLTVHVGLVEKHAREIADRLTLPKEIRQGLELAATWHDHGKDREIWQQAVGHKADRPPLGKSGGFMRRIPGDYRHEFGSLRKFSEDHAEKVDSDVFDLAMHLIATHHGRGRPHFPKGGFDPDARARSPQIGIDAVRRFARLQRKHGHWRLTWLENLLRCADALASAEKVGAE